jgi:hypothetical protein
MSVPRFNTIHFLREILVDINAHEENDLDEVSSSHGRHGGESIGGEPHTLGMVACNFM